MWAAAVLLAASVAMAQQGPAAIKVDQYAYILDAPKQAIVVSNSATGPFSLVSAQDGTPVYTGSLAAPMIDADTGDSVRLADFSSVNTEGTYYLDVAGVGKSYNFKIATANVYERIFYLGMRAFYGLRCNTDVNFAPDFPELQKKNCHTNAQFHPSSGKSGRVNPYTGGWHDAGDWGRYMPNSAITTGTLLHAFELFGNTIKDINLNLPESGDSTPDMLDEIKWNLRWMLSMQDTDGGCWHKQTSEGWPGFISPENDPFVNYVIGTGKSTNKGTCATAGLAAVGAIASRVYRQYDPDFADQCLNAARKAFIWATGNPQETFTANPPPVQSGMYDDADCSDELFWASAELARTTQEPVYENYFRSNKSKFRAGQTPSWQTVGSFGLFTYALRNLRNQDSFDVRGSLVFRGDELVNRISKANYRHSLLSNEYVWGSNGVLLNQAIELLVAYQISPKPEYINAVLENLHYAFGRNTFSTSFVSRVGTNYVKNFHFRQDIADGIADPWPGYISGGPNKDRQDPPSSALPASVPPARVWLDNIESYATNEIAINWNSPFVFVLAGVLDAYKASGAPSRPIPPPSRPTPPPSRPTPPPSRPTPAPSRPTPAPSQSTPAPSQTTPAPSQSTPAPTQTTAAPTRPSPPPTRPNPRPAQPEQCAKVWDQCGGKDFLGPSCCEPGLVCRHYSEWYAQCTNF